MKPDGRECMTDRPALRAGGAVIRNWGLLLCHARPVVDGGHDVREVLVTLASDLAGEQEAGLGAALQLEQMAGLCRELATDLVLDAVERRRVSWVTVGRVFGVSRQGAAKRFAGR